MATAVVVSLYKGRVVVLGENVLLVLPCLCLVSKSPKASE